VKLRALNEPRPVRVLADGNGAPLAVAHERRRLGVEAVLETWRIDDEWWRQPISRRYHIVVLEGGRSMTLYQDLAEGGWYVQG
jgi:hypothetical protein